ncbi:MAG: ion transporter [Anaerostipes sp.]|jgi:voltage-gated potassium channel
MINRIYQIIEVAKDDDVLSKIYDIIMMITIILSIIPLCFYKQSHIFLLLDKITVSIFIVDYFLRIITADKEKKRGVISYFLYPFKPIALIDLLAIIPSFIPINSAFKALKMLRLCRTFRLFKAIRYSKNIHIIVNVFKHEKDQLITVFALAVIYIFTTALIAFFPSRTQNFRNIFQGNLLVYCFTNNCWLWRHLSII